MADPEKLAGEKIDSTLEQCGWAVQNKNAANLAASRGVAVKGVPFGIASVAFAGEFLFLRWDSSLTKPDWSAEE